MDEVNSTLQTGKGNKNTALTAAFKAYDAARRERSQWLVQSARQVCEIYEWTDPKCGSDPEKCLKEIEWRARKIWYFDIDGFISDARILYERFLQVEQASVLGL